MSFEQTWNEAVPVDTDLVAHTDDYFRSLKTAIRERGGVEHRTYADETGKTDVWKHKPGFVVTDYIAERAITGSKIAPGAITPDLIAGGDIRAAQVLRPEEVELSRWWANILQITITQAQWSCINVGAAVTVWGAGRPVDVRLMVQGVLAWEGSIRLEAGGGGGISVPRTSTVFGRAHIHFGSGTYTYAFDARADYGGRLAHSGISIIYR